MRYLPVTLKEPWFYLKRNRIQFNEPLWITHFDWYTRGSVISWHVFHIRQVLKWHTVEYYEPPTVLRKPRDARIPEVKENNGILEL